MTKIFQIKGTDCSTCKIKSICKYSDTFKAAKEMITEQFKNEKQEDLNFTIDLYCDYKYSDNFARNANPIIEDVNSTSSKNF